MDTFAQKYGAFLTLLAQLAAIVWWASTVNSSIASLNKIVAENSQVAMAAKERILVIDERVKNLTEKVERQEELLEAVNARIPTRH